MSATTDAAAVARARARLVRWRRVRARYWGVMSERGRWLVDRVTADEYAVLRRAGLAEEARVLVAPDGAER